MGRDQVRQILFLAYSELNRKAPNELSIVALAAESGVARSVIYRDHPDIVDMMRRRNTPGKLEEVEILRLKVSKLNKLLKREKQTSADLSAVCTNLIYNLNIEKDRTQRLEGRLRRIGRI